MTAGVERQTHDGVTGLCQGQHNSTVGLGAGVRLDVGEAAVEQGFGAVDSNLLDFVRGATALVVTLARIAFGVLVGEHGALGFEHGAAYYVFRRDEFDLGLLAFEFMLHTSKYCGIGLGHAAFKKAFRPVAASERGLGHWIAFASAERT